MTISSIEEKKISFFKAIEFYFENLGVCGMSRFMRDLSISKALEVKL